MMRTLIIITIGVIMGCACDKKIISMDPGPLITVVKLNSAESISDRKEAEKYIDVRSVYDPNKYVKELTNNTPTPDEIYDQYLIFLKYLRNDKKLTTELLYYKYAIHQEINNEIAEVVFNSLESDEKIVYKLKLIDGSWIVKDIVRSMRNLDEQSIQK